MSTKNSSAGGDPRFIRSTMRGHSIQVSYQDELAANRNPVLAEIIQKAAAQTGTSMDQFIKAMNSFGLAAQGATPQKSSGDRLDRTSKEVLRDVEVGLLTLRTNLPEDELSATAEVISRADMIADDISSLLYFLLQEPMDRGRVTSVEVTFHSSAEAFLFRLLAKRTTRSTYGNQGWTQVSTPRSELEESFIKLRTLLALGEHDGGLRRALEDIATQLVRGPTGYVLLQPGMPTR